MSFKKVNPKQNFPELEMEMVRFWNSNKIFEKSVEAKDKSKTFSFYDGPPFATGTPHYGHIIAGTIKDVIPRFKTMQGYRVDRIWGWDTHGLPIENIVEQELDFKSKTQVEEYGVDKFNEKCRTKVLAYADEWEKIVERTGRWVDMKNAYLTMDQKFMESVWWVFKTLWDKKLIYQGHKVMPFCPRCSTGLSNFEVGQGYKDKNDKAITVKFELVDEPGTYVLAWTTTPWTLPGNLALTLGAKIEYAKVEVNGERYILAKERLLAYEDVFGKVKILEIFKGKDMVGKKYYPVFDFYKNVQKAFEIISGEFVSTQDGTGIVHTAPAFGEDDYKVAKEHGIDFFMPVDDLGNFTIDVPDYAGQSVVNFETNQSIIKDLTAKNIVVKVEDISHSYPHCWRCDTPLIYKAVDSYLVAVEKLKEQMLENNSKIKWMPGAIGKNRFAKLIEGAPDWNISRNRFWGTPLPVWKCEKCYEVKVIGSTEELIENANYPITKLIVVRHGEAENNLRNIKSDAKGKYPLTEKGRDKAKVTATTLPDEVDVFISSPTLRAKETAEIVKAEKGYSQEIRFDERLAEFNFGKWDDVSDDNLLMQSDYLDYKKLDNKAKFSFKLGHTGESRADMVGRVQKLINEIVAKYQGKTVLLVTHGPVINSIKMALNDLDLDSYYLLEKVSKKGGSRGSAEVFFLNPEGKMVDLHKHYIDEVEFECDKCKGSMKSTGEVLDCWFESGSMPYASIHYPFENIEKYKRDFPADFIAEGIDQTRGWFYSLLVLSTALEGVSSYKNVVVNGTVLAEDGQKMSKRLRNYPDPTAMMEKYGADAMRFYLMASPAVKAGDLNFSEKGVEEVVKSLILRLWNSYSFFVTYASLDDFKPAGMLETQNVLDRWMLSITNGLVENVTKALEKYDISLACRYLNEFIEELSNWYIRRSRKRFWKSENDSDKVQAYETLHYVLVTYVKLLAPFMPFVTEEIYKNLTGEESVHLAEWPAVDKEMNHLELEENMNMIRSAVELGLSSRAEAGIKVRQPLPGITISSDLKPKQNLLDIVAEEVNVKKVDLQKAESLSVDLDTNITPELKAEGIARDFVRFVQDGRKKAGFNVEDRISLSWKIDNKEVTKALEKQKEYIAKETLALEINSKKEDYEYEQNVKLDGKDVWFGISRSDKS